MSFFFFCDPTSFSPPPVASSPATMGSHARFPPPPVFFLPPLSETTFERDGVIKECFPSMDVRALHLIFFFPFHDKHDRSVSDRICVTHSRAAGGRLFMSVREKARRGGRRDAETGMERKTKEGRRSGKGRSAAGGQVAFSRAALAVQFGVHLHTATASSCWRGQEECGCSM